jgi:hypothetical protein
VTRRPTTAACFSAMWRWPGCELQRKACLRRRGLGGSRDGDRGGSAAPLARAATGPARERAAAGQAGLPLQTGAAQLPPLRRALAGGLSTAPALRPRAAAAPALYALPLPAEAVEAAEAEAGAWAGGYAWHEGGGRA